MKAALITLGTQTQDPETDTTGPDTDVPGSKHRATQNTACTKLPQSEPETRQPPGAQRAHRREFQDVYIVRFPETSTKVKTQG